MSNKPKTVEESGAGPCQKRLERILKRLGCAWDIAQDLGQVLKYTRLPLLVTLPAGLALIFVDQGQELVLIQAGNFWAHWAFYPAITFWALNAWYWSRVTLAHGAPVPFEETCPTRPFFGGRLKRVQWLVKHVPRLIGSSAFLLVAIAQFMVAGRDGVSPNTAGLLQIYAFVTLGLAVLFYIFVLGRRSIAKWLRARLDSKRASARTAWLEIPDQPSYDPKASTTQLPAPVRFIFLGLTVALVTAFVMASLAPVTLGALGPEVIFLVGASLWIAPGTWALFVTRRGDFPLITFVLVLGFAFSFINDNHGLWAPDPGDGASLSTRPTLAEALKDWDGTSRDRPVVMVATAGGGSRAAYWTATVLGTIQDMDPDFDEALLGISGVSGGSLGAVVYRGLLTALPRGGANCAAPGVAGYRVCGQAILGGDFLGAALAGTLFPDLVSRILPWGVLPDRAEALQAAWEQAWERALGAGHTDDARLMAKDFFAAWGPPDKPEPALPALFLNGTSVATGKRIVTTNLDLAGVLTDAFEFFEHWPTQIRLSTAANNSSRFPIVAPAGTLKRESTSDDPNTMDRIVDGGYFENFGAATALDILERLVREPKVEPTQLVVIQISSDPDYGGVDGGEGRRRTASPGSFAGELRSPLNALLNTRTARGVLAAQRLHDWTVANSGTFVELRLIESKEYSVPPLGWTLSAEARLNMDCQLLHQENWKQLRKLSERLDFSDKLGALQQQLKERCPNSQVVDTP